MKRWAVPENTNSAVRRASKVVGKGIGTPEEIEAARAVLSNYRLAHDPNAIVAQRHVYFDRGLNDMVYQLSRIYPTPEHENIGFYYVGAGSAVPFSVLMLNSLPDLHVTGAGSGGQFFPRWTYVPIDDESTLFNEGERDGEVHGYRRVDNITDDTLERFQAVYGDGASKDDIFFYVYGLLHSPQYREEYAADLTKMLPRVPLVEDPQPFTDAGRQLADLHVGYERVEPYPLDGLQVGPAGTDDAAYNFYRVEKMRFGKPTAEQKAAGERWDRSMIVYNSRIALREVPAEAYRYMLGSRSAIEWIMDRYQVKVDKASGIRNDPNDWSRQVGDPRYILDLLARIVTVSLKTMEVVDGLPALKVLDLRR